MRDAEALGIHARTTATRGGSCRADIFPISLILANGKIFAPEFDIVDAHPT